MTCEEFRALVEKGGPDSCTRAEFAAAKSHRQSCRLCSEWLEVGANEDEKRISELPAGERELVKVCMNVLAAAVVAGANRDPESSYQAEIT
jgi:hypothetical protein